MLQIEIFDKKLHDRASFYSGNKELDEYLKILARQDISENYCQLYVVISSEDPMPKRIYGYFTLNAYMLVSDFLSGTSEKVKRYPDIPAILIGRLAKGLKHNKISGGEILYAALVKAKKASLDIGVKYVVVHAKNEEAAQFYQRHGFLKLPPKKNWFVINLKSIKI